MNVWINVWMNEGRNVWMKEWMNRRNQILDVIEVNTGLMEAQRTRTDTTSKILQAELIPHFLWLSSHQSLCPYPSFLTHLSQRPRIRPGCLWSTEESRKLSRWNRKSSLDVVVVECICKRRSVQTFVRFLSLSQISGKIFWSMNWCCFNLSFLFGTWM